MGSTLFEDEPKTSPDLHPPSARPRRMPSLSGEEAAVAATAAERRRSRPSFAAIDEVVADVARDPRYEG
jgi:hypothetical protein